MTKNPIPVFPVEPQIITVFCNVEIKDEKGMVFNNFSGYKSIKDYLFALAQGIFYKHIPLGCPTQISSTSHVRTEASKKELTFQLDRSMVSFSVSEPLSLDRPLSFKPHKLSSKSTIHFCNSLNKLFDLIEQEHRISYVQPKSK